MYLWLNKAFKYVKLHIFRIKKRETFLHLPDVEKILFTKWLLNVLGDDGILKDAERTSWRDDGLAEPSQARLVPKLGLLLLEWAADLFEDDIERRCNDDNNASSVLSFTIVDGYGGGWSADVWIIRGALSRRILHLWISDERKFELDISFDGLLCTDICFATERDGKRGDTEHDLVVVGIIFGGVTGGMINTLCRTSVVVDVDGGSSSSDEFEWNKRRKNKPNLAIDK